MTGDTQVFLESARRTFAGAIEWPGWCRGGRDEAAALQALIDAGPRYAAVVRGAGLGFRAPGAVSQLEVVERLQGNATTDFGAPGAVPSADSRPVTADELSRLTAILQCAWQAFDEAVAAAAGQVLRTGPRGGGRTVDGIVQHVTGAERGYLTSLGWSFRSEADPPDPAALRAAIVEGLSAAARGEIEPEGPRGGKRWPPRYFIRRDAWHVLDHVWEIEDRLRTDE
jgi:hypothetical protein